MGYKEKKQEFKSKIDLEKKKFKNMKSIKDKIDYIWEYYKISIIVTLTFVIIIGYIINLTVINPPNKPAVGLVIAQPTIVDTNIIKNDIEKNIDIEKGYEAVVTHLPIGSSSQDLAYEQGLNQKLFLMMTVGEADIIIASEEMISTNAVGGMFLDISQVLKDDKYNNLKDKYVNGLIPQDMADPKTIDKNQLVEYDKSMYIERPVGIKIDNCKVLEDLGYDTKGSVIAFPSTSKKEEIKMKLFNYIMSIT